MAKHGARPEAAAPPAHIKKAVDGKIRGLGVGSKVDLKPLCQEYKRLSDDLDLAEAEVTRLKGERGILSDEMVQKFEQAGLQSAKMEGLGVFYVNATARPSVVDESLLFADLKRRKMGDLIRYSVNAQTLAAAVRELREKKEPDLAGIAIYEQTAIRMRKA